MAPELLEQVLKTLPETQDPEGRLLCSFNGHEDAAVLRFPVGKALVQTVDILTPIGNDPYVFGQIAAANALSDVYAMGGEPWCAMNVVFFPSPEHADGTTGDDELGLDTLSRILQGGQDKMQEAGAVLAGGHTVADKEPKYGLSVTGFIDPDCVASNKGLRVGDRLLLTKPLGTGILSTAVKAHWGEWEKAEAEFCHWATRLNKGGAKVIRALKLRAATDITGFGLGGHAMEMAKASKLSIMINASSVPLMSRILDFAGDGFVPRGSFANKRHAECRTLVENNVDPLLVSVIFDAQTSGGLLLAVPPELVPQANSLLAENGDLCVDVGEVQTARDDGKLLLIRP